MTMMILVKAFKKLTIRPTFPSHFSAFSVRLLFMFFASYRKKSTNIITTAWRDTFSCFGKVCFFFITYIYVCVWKRQQWIFYRTDLLLEIKMYEKTFIQKNTLEIMISLYSWTIFFIHFYFCMYVYVCVCVCVCVYV